MDAQKFYGDISVVGDIKANGLTLGTNKFFADKELNLTLSSTIGMITVVNCTGHITIENGTIGILNIISSPALSVENKASTTLQTIRDGYGIGSYYISEGTAPNTLFGGEWEQLPDGTFLMASGSAHATGSTGGSKDAVVVEHTHNVYMQTEYYTEGPYGISFSTSEPNFNPNSSRKTDTAGVDGTDKNLPPYRATPIYKRIRVSGIE